MGSVLGELCQKLGEGSWGRYGRAVLAGAGQHLCQEVSGHKVRA